MIASTRVPDLRRGHPAGEGGLDDLVDRAPENDRQPEGGHRVQERPAHRSHERLGVGAHVGPDQADPAGEQSPLMTLESRSGLASLSSLAVDVPLPQGPPEARVAGVVGPWNDAAMTHHRPWFASWRSGTPKTLEPYPEASAYSMLVGAAATYPDSVALAFLGKHITYRDMLEEVERFSGGLSGLGVHAGRPGGAAAPQLSAVRDRLVRLSATRRDRRREQPPLHPAGVAAPDQRFVTPRHHLARSVLPAVGRDRCRHEGLRGDRHEADGLHEVPTESARAAQVPQGGQARGEALAARPFRRPRASMERPDEAGPAAAPGRRGRRAERLRGLRLHGRYHRGIEGGDALSLQHRGERHAGGRVHRRVRRPARTA